MGLSGTWPILDVSRLLSTQSPVSVRALWRSTWATQEDSCSGFKVWDLHELLSDLHQHSGEEFHLNASLPKVSSHGIDTGWSEMTSKKFHFSRQNLQNNSESSVFWLCGYICEKMSLSGKLWRDHQSGLINIYVIPIIYHTVSVNWGILKRWASTFWNSHVNMFVKTKSI